MRLEDMAEQWDLSPTVMKRKILKHSAYLNRILLHEEGGLITVDPEYAKSMQAKRDEVISLIPSELSPSELIPFAKGSYIYFLYDIGELVYIGETISLGARLRQHQDNQASAPAKQFDAVAYIDVEPRYRKSLELECIKYYNPPLNCEASESPWNYYTS